MKINMSLIAKEAGLSRYTVSKILGGDSTVKAESRRRVRELCERYGYLPDDHAVGLVKGKTNLIAMVVPYITDAFYSEIIELTEGFAEGAGYRVLFKSSYNQAAKEAEILKGFLALKVCAMVVVPVVDGPDLRLHALAGKRVPMVYLDRPLASAAHHILNDNAASAETMTRHLLKKTRDVAFLDSFYGSLNPTAVARRQGYVRAMEARGQRPRFIPVDASRERQDNEPYGFENMARFLEAGGRAEAVFCITDAVALGACKAIYGAGMIPGKDIMVAGHDDLRFGAYAHPTLTTMRQPKERLSQACIQTLDQLICGKRVAEKVQVFGSELVIRESA